MQKNKSSFITISVLLILSLCAVFFYFNKNKTSTLEDKEDRAFGVADTAGISKITITNKEGEISSLKRTANGWVVNDKFHCRQDAILNLLECVKRVEVKMPVPKQMKEGVLRFMSSLAVKVEIYNKENNKIKQYYVGHEPPDYEGSYMLLTNLEDGNNYSNPYITFIPDFKGFLKPRYIANENEWRDVVVMAFTPPQIKQIKVEYSEQPDSSFTIDLESTTKFTLRDSKNNSCAFLESKMKQYLAYYQHIAYEALITGKNKKLEDSLFTNKPFCKITVSEKPFKTNIYELYRKQPKKGKNENENGVSYAYDPDRFYLRFDGGKEWALTQYFVFGKLLITPPYFK